MAEPDAGYTIAKKEQSVRQIKRKLAGMSVVPFEGLQLCRKVEEQIKQLKEKK